MNRFQRRLLMKQMATRGVSLENAKKYVNENFSQVSLKVGDRVKFNWPLMERHPDWKHQLNSFKEWCEQHKGEIFTVSGLKDERGYLVEFEEDENKVKFTHNSQYLIPVATATVKMENGEERVVDVGDVRDVNDPKILQKVGEVLSED